MKENNNNNAFNIANAWHSDLFQFTDKINEEKQRENERRLERLINQRFAEERAQLAKMLEVLEDTNRKINVLFTQNVRLF